MLDRRLLYLMESHAPLSHLPLSSDRLQVSLLREQVSDLLRQAIVDMRLNPGDRLIERELVEWTGVSRATVREALRQLAAEGLVKTIPQRGAVVAAPSRKEAAEVYEIRARLEGPAARQFTGRASTSEMRALRRPLRGLERASTGASDTRTLLQAKNRFYEVLFRGAGNSTVQSLLGLLQARITVLRATTMSQPGRPMEALAEIRAIVEAIERRDGEAAERACSYHVQQAARYALQALTEEEERASGGR